MSLLIMAMSLSIGCSQKIMPPQLDKVYVVIYVENNSTHELVPTQTQVEYRDVYQFENKVQQEDSDEMFNITTKRMFMFDPLDSLLDLPIRVMPGKNIAHDKKQNISSPEWRSYRRAHLQNNNRLVNTTIREQLQKEGEFTLMVNKTTFNDLGLHELVKDETHFSTLWLTLIITGLAIIIAAVLFYFTIRRIRGGRLKNRSPPTSCDDPNSMQLINI